MNRRKRALNSSSSVYAMWANWRSIWNKIPAEEARIEADEAYRKAVAECRAVQIGDTIA